MGGQPRVYSLLGGCILSLDGRGLSFVTLFPPRVRSTVAARLDPPPLL
jgi:hypothetical protein